ncbi:MAG: hypothetical protein CL927_10350 [Deltaproteobacteria bacterium]|nr:hypothetical protein [Deltaproteobacteria bacterium]HCH65130.1 hypothetical protein [Deltaproteobacteria bacterium]
MATVDSTDTFVGSFHFEVTIPGVSDTNAAYNTKFTRVSGVSSESEQLTWMQGSDRSVNTAPGRVKYADITLERVFDGVDAFYTWRRRIENGQFITADGTSTGYRRDVVVRMFRRDFRVEGTKCVRKMVLRGAWPSRWQLPDLDANSSNLAIETIVLTVSDVEEGIPD